MNLRSLKKHLETGIYKLREKEVKKLIKDKKIKNL